MEPPLPPTPPLQIERAVAPIAFPDPAVEATLRQVLFPPGSPRGACQRQGGARYVFNRFDLDGDRQPETLVAVLGQQRCGPEGCPLLVLKRDGARLVPLQRVLGLRSALVVSERRSQGWLDLLLPRGEGASGGGAGGAASGAPAGAPLRLAYNGVGYAARGEGAAGGAGDRASQALANRGISALVLSSSPWLVQGHPLPCPTAAAGGEAAGRWWGWVWRG